MTRILIVEDEESFSDPLSYSLRKEGYEVAVADDGTDGLRIFSAHGADLVLLDLMLPGMDGIQVCQTIRQSSDIPIVMLTAKSDTADVVRGLEAGADDYVPKPFKPAELVARVKARLRPIERGATQEITLGDIVIDVTGHSVTREGEQISLTPLEFDLLTTLAKSPNQVFSRDELLRDVWGYPHAADNRLVNVHVQRLRSKVERDPENPELVLTVRGIGYKAGGHSHR